MQSPSDEDGDRGPLNDWCMPHFNTIGTQEQKETNTTRASIGVHGENGATKDASSTSPDDVEQHKDDAGAAGESGQEASYERSEGDLDFMHYSQ